MQKNYFIVALLASTLAVAGLSAKSKSQHNMDEVYDKVERIERRLDALINDLTNHGEYDSKTYRLRSGSGGLLIQIKDQLYTLRDKVDKLYHGY